MPILYLIIAFFVIRYLTGSSFMGAIATISIVAFFVWVMFSAAAM